ncbi:MAG: molybdenum cofactor guanylyltransferase MobA [Burkholderiaceae bacterium]
MNTQTITAIILAGGRGSRMGGVDKGLQTFNGVPLALHTLMRLQMQEGGVIAETMVNANRNLAAYEAMGVSVWPDAAPSEFAGPLAGFLTGLERCETPYLLTVPCDTPLFPLDLAQRLANALEREDAEIAMACAPETDEAGQTRTRAQPVFCLLSASLLESLAAFMQSGGRKIDAWTAQHRCVTVPFDLPGDNPRAFANANTLAELHQLQV